MANATRLYAIGGTPVISPAVAGGWELSTNLLRTKLSRTFSDSGSSIQAILTAGSGVANDDQASIQGIFGPLAGQRLSGNVKGQMTCREVSGATDARAQMTIRVISFGGTVRFTPLAFDTAALSSEFIIDSSDANARNIKNPRGGSTALTAGNIFPGDFLVVEWGFRNHGTNTSNVRVRLVETGSATTDSPEDETTTTGNSSGYRGWIEFDSEIRLFQPGPLTFDVGIAGT